MAHPCCECGGECYCNGDIDDCIVSKTPRSCKSCGCKDSNSFFDDMEEDYFTPCDKCDGHDACEDFGCAIEAGLSKMVKKNIEPGNDHWG
jgi:hypothetical protein